jgi:hypothetical protein
MQEIQSPASSFSLFCKSHAEARVMRNWIRGLDVETSCSSITQRFRTGIFPFHVLEKIGVRFNREKIVFDPRCKKDCLQNLRYLLRVLGKSGLGTFEFSEKNLYLGKSEEIWKIILFVFEDVYFKKCFKDCDDVFRWASLALMMKVGGHNLVSVLKDLRVLEKLLGVDERFLNSPSNSFKNLEKNFKQAKITLLFDFQDYEGNENFKFSYIQMFLIFQHFSGNNFKGSIDSCSKETGLETNFSMEILASPNEKVQNLEENVKNSDVFKGKGFKNPEEKVKNSDVFREKGKNEKNFEEKVKNSDVFGEKGKNEKNFEENMKKSDYFKENEKNDKNFEEIVENFDMFDENHLILKQFDFALCFLEVPRIVQVYEPERLIRAFIQLFEGDDRMAFIEVNDIESQSCLARFQIAMIEELGVDGNSCDIFLRNNHVKIVFKSEVECENYSKALSIVYETGNN